MLMCFNLVEGVLMRWLVLLALLWPVTALAGWFSDDNYDECMLSKMKGQNQSMYMTAHKACARTFGIEQTINQNGIKISWDNDRWEIRLEVEQNTSEFSITKGEFIFSKKPCAESVAVDFDTKATVLFKSDKAIQSIMTNDLKCKKTIELWGKYK